MLSLLFMPLPLVGVKGMNGPERFGITGDVLSSDVCRIPVSSSFLEGVPKPLNVTPAVGNPANVADEKIFDSEILLGMLLVVCIVVSTPITSKISESTVEPSEFPETTPS